MLTRYRAVAFQDSTHGERARKFLKTVPDLTEYEWRFYRSFWELGTERSFNIVPGPIPRSAIVAYADEEGIDDPSERIIFKRFIRTLDNAYLNACAAKRAREESNK